MVRERVQVPRPRNPAGLRPTATPNITPMEATRPDVSRYAQFVESLSRIEPRLQAIIQDDANRRIEEDSAAAYDRIMAMSPDEARALIESGQLRETESPWFDAAFRKQFGIIHAADRKRRILHEYKNNFDPETQNLEEWLTSWVEEDQQAYSQDKWIMSGYREGMGDFLTRFRDQHSQFISERRKEQSTQNFYSHLMDTVSSAMDRSEDPVAAWRALYEEYRNSPLKMSYATMDEFTLQAMEAFAREGKLSIVEKVLTADVVGVDGQRVGTFLERAKFAPRANAILEEARRVHLQNLKVESTGAILMLEEKAKLGQLDEANVTRIRELAQTGVIKPEQAAKLIATNVYTLQRSAAFSQAAQLVFTGNAHQVRDVELLDPNGNPTTITANEMVETGVLDLIAKLEADNIPIPQQAGILSAISTDVNNPKWEQRLTNGILSASAQLLQSKDGTWTLPEPAKQAYALWKALGQYPELRARHVKNKNALDVLGTAEVLERLGDDPETALLRAVEAEEVAKTGGLSTVLDRNLFTNTMDRLMRDTGAVNRGYAEMMIERAARVYGANLNDKEALEVAVAKFNASHEVINGVLINTANRTIPADFSPAVTLVLDEFAAKHGIRREKLTLKPWLMGENNWMVVHSDTLEPLVSMDAGFVFSTQQIMNAFEKVRGTDTERRLRQLQRSTDTTRFWIEQRDRTGRYDEAVRRMQTPPTAPLPPWSPLNE